MNYRVDKLIVTTHTDGRTHRQTQATTIPEDHNWPRVNKANLRDLIAATGLVILLKLDSNRRFVTLKFDGWPWKTIGHLFYATSIFVHHLVAIDELKLELQPGNAQSGSNSTIFLSVWHKNFTDDPEKQEGTSSMLLQALCIISYPLVN